MFAIGLPMGTIRASFGRQRQNVTSTAASVREQTEVTEAMSSNMKAAAAEAAGIRV